MYEGLKRMTQGRLDDQRGTEINMELPDFLKKEGASQVFHYIMRGNQSFPPCCLSPVLLFPQVQILLILG